MHLTIKPKLFIKSIIELGLWKHQWLVIEHVHTLSHVAVAQSLLATSNSSQYFCHIHPLVYMSGISF